MTTFAFFGDEVITKAFITVFTEARYSQAPSSSAEVILTYQASLSGLEELYFGDDGIVMNACDGAVFVDLSPTVPSFADELYQLATVNNATLVAAPLIVKNPVMQQAFTPSNVMIVAGAEHAAYEQVRDLLQVLAKRVLFFGSVSEAQTYKMAHTVAHASGMVSLAESFAALRGVGVDESLTSSVTCDPEDLVDILTTSTGLSSGQDSFVQAMIEFEFEGTYTVGIVMAELAAALAWLEETDMLLPQADASFHLYELLALVGGASYNPAALSLLFAPEEETKAYNLNWSAVEERYDHESSNEYDEYVLDDYEAEYDDDRCVCGHDHHHHDHCGHDHNHGDCDHDHDMCDCDHDHGDSSRDYGFSAN